jgi:hypothetical protein
MQGSAWVALLQRVPPEQWDNLLVMTGNGIGITVKGIVRMEKEYMIVRGRLTGTNEEGGGFFFVPYEQINYVGFQRAIKETVIQSMYAGEPAASIAAGAESPEKGDEQPSAGSGETPPSEPSPAEAGDAAEALKPATPGKAALLERLRARRVGGDNAKP